MEAVSIFNQQSASYKRNRRFLLRSFASKEEFVREYKKFYYGKAEAEELFLLIFAELEKAISLGNIDTLRKLNHIINYISEIEEQVTFKDYCNNANNPIKHTNLVILACKENKQEILKYLFDNNKLLNNLSKNIEESAILPTNEDETSHNAFYYAIRSGNVELLDTLINKWPGNYFSSHLTELDAILSKAYEELKLKHVPLSDQIEIFVESKLINLRFFSQASKHDKSHRCNLNNIKERIELILDNIDLLKTEYSGGEKVDGKFLFVAKFIAQNIHILKQQLKSTYDRMPWEEMEFYLVCFVSSFAKRQEINLFYCAIMNKRKVLNQLDNFRKKLEQLRDDTSRMDFDKVSDLPRLKRDTVVARIIKDSPELEELYDDYQQIRDIYSLERINDYIQLALETDPAEREGQLIITRVLQVIGEYLKNTLESPKLSNATCDILLLSLPKYTREVVIDLRNSLSHAYSLSKRTEIEQNTDANFFKGIKDDIRKVGDVVNDIFYGNKIKMIRILLKKIVDSENVDEMKEIVAELSTIEFNKTTPESFKVMEHEKLEEYIEELNNIVIDKTDYEEDLFDKINNVMNFAKIESKNMRADYMTGFLSLQCLSLTFNDNKINPNIIRGLKFFANKILQNVTPRIESHDLKEIAELSMKICHSVKSRIQDESYVMEIRRLILEILYIVEFGINDIKWITSLKEKLNEKGTSMPFYKQRSIYNVSETEYNKQLELKLSELKDILNNHALNDQFIEKSSPYKENERLQVVIKMLVLDIMSILSTSKNYLEDNLLFLDDNIPLLTGKCLRNHLAHDNALTDILLLDPSISVVLNARKLTSENLLKKKKKIGKLVKEDISKLKEKYDRSLAMIANQKRMFVALSEGDLEKLKDCIEKGADVHARDINMWTTVHFAAKGPSVEVVKFILDQNVSLDVKDINGQSPLHIAAVHERTDIVEFLVEETELCIDDRDYKGKTPLHIAAQNGDKKTVEILLKLDANINIQDMAGFSPLHSAVKNNHIDVVKFLLKNEANFDVNELMGGFTPLYIAAENGHPELVDFLLENGANVNARTDRGAVPLHPAALNGHLEVVNALISKGADVNAKVLEGCTPLHYAIENGHEEIGKILINHGADVNVSDNTYKNTPLHYAAKDGHVRIVKMLLENKADANVATVEGFTPLHLAVQSGHLEIVTVLLNHGVNVNSKDNHETSPLHYAAEGGYKEIAELLIKNGAEVNAKDENDFVPLHLAALRGHTDVAELLIENKSGVNIRDIKGCTPLHVAAINGSKDIVDLLIKNKAEVNAKNHHGITPLHSAAAKGDKDVINLLIQNKAKVNARSDDHITPLHAAATHGYQDAVTLLIENGAEVNSRAILNITPLQSAIMGGHKDVAKILIENNAEVNSTNVTGNTPLHIAVDTENKELTEILLRNGADVNVTNGHNLTPLLSAIKKNFKEIVEVLIANGADVNAEGGEPLSLAVFAGYKDIVKILLQNKARVNLKFQKDSTPLHLAAKRGHTEIANILIEKGADVNVTSIGGYTPLHCAAQERHKETVELLLSKGANINAKCADGTPLHLAVGKYGHVDVVRVLLKYKANINVKDLKNRTILEMAVAYNQLESVKAILLQHKEININAKGNDNWTVLHIAAQEGNLEMVKYLVDQGCDINAKNASGSKPIHLAAREGFKDIVEYFLCKGCTIYDLGTANQTLLHYAAMNGQVEVVKYLIEKGADINIQDRQGLSPMHLAANFDQGNVIEILLQNGAIYNSLDKFCRRPSELATSEDVIDQLIATERLFGAIKRNDLVEVLNCIKLGAIVNAKHAGAKAYEGTPLDYAAWKGFDEIVNILLQNKANPNIPGNKGFTALHYAAKFSHLKVVTTLLSNGAVYNAVSEGGKTPLDFAIDRSIISLLKLIGESFKNVRNDNSKVLHDLNKLKDINAIKAVMSARNKEKQTLIVAAMHSNFSKIKQLKEIGQGDVSSQIDTALMFLQQENYYVALSIFKSAFDRRLEILGPDNPATLDIQIYVAKILYKQGSFQEAADMLDEIYNKQKESLGLYNKETLSTRSIYALILHRQGKDEEAFNIYQDIYKKQRELLGPDHSDTLDTQFHMAMVLDKQEKYEEALKMNRDVLKKRKEIFGANHPTTICTQNNIAMVLANQGKYEEALKMYELVFEKKRMIFGIHHSDTLRTLFNIAGILLQQKKYNEALKAHRDLFDIQRITFGRCHPDTLNTQYNLANVYFAQGKWISALKVYSECLEKRTAVFGPTHPTVLDIIQKIEAINYRFKLEGSEASEIIGHFQRDINIASSNGNIQTVRSLLKNGADPNIKDADGRTPLHFAVSNGHADVVNILLENGADPTQETNKGNTPLHTAATKNHRDIIERLLEHVTRDKLNEYINVKTTASGTTSLHIAAKNGSMDIVKCLLAHGASYNIENNEGKTPLEVSTNQRISSLLKLIDKMFKDTKIGDIEVIENLETLPPDEFVAVTNARDCHGSTLLQVAIFNKRKDVASKLLKLMQNRDIDT